MMWANAGIIYCSQLTMMWANAGIIYCSQLLAPYNNYNLTHTGRYTRVVDDSERCSSADADTESDDTEESAAAAEEPAAATAVVTQLDVTRRQQDFGVIREAAGQQNSGAIREAGGTPRDVAALQTLWQEHAANAEALYPSSMWRLLHAVREETIKTQTNVLRACRHLLSSQEKKSWPTSRKAVTNAINKLGSFRVRVTREILIDLSHHHNFPSLAKPVKFRFIDPVFAWSLCAHYLSKNHVLYFEYKELRHPSMAEPLYGHSVENGEIMRNACRKYPRPALVGLSYDGGLASKRRSYTPILISVGNTDYAGLHSCVCIGYLPQLSLASVSSKEDAKVVMHELRQACVGAIVDIIEANAVDGFKCLFPNGDVNVLFPVLARMEFDTKERYKFFCCARQHACGIGSGPRQGHSVLRPCTPHSARLDLPAKRRNVALRGQTAEAAASSLSRRGIHPFRRCTALEGREHCVLNWPGRLYFGLFAYDVLHILYINCIGYLLDAVLDNLTPTLKIELDRRTRSLGPFRNPCNGLSTRRVRRLSSTGYLSAELKVVHLFVWSHAIGSRALIIPENIRQDTLIALSSLQTICFSVRGLRPFTRAEHNYIFLNLGKRFFRSLSNIRHAKKQQQIQNAINYNIGKPEAKRRRVPHWVPARKLSGESEDTAPSSAEDVPPYYIRSDKIVPHAFVHFTEQVCLGGSHKFHDTAAQEATHPKCLGLAGARTRAYADLNQTSDSMLEYTWDRLLMDKIYEQAKIDGITHSISARHPQYIPPVQYIFTAPTVYMHTAPTVYICTTPTVYILTTPTVYLTGAHRIYSLHPQCICSTPTVYMYTAPTVYIQDTHSIYFTAPTVYIHCTHSVYLHDPHSVYPHDTHSISH